MVADERVSLAADFATALGRYDPRKLDAARELAMSPEDLQDKVAKYGSTIFACGCPDHAYRHVTCKHMIAQMLISGLFP